MKVKDNEWTLWSLEGGGGGSEKEFLMQTLYEMQNKKKLEIHCPEFTGTEPMLTFWS